LHDQSLKNSQFKRMVAIKKQFVNCDFRNSEFDSAYIRDCVFNSCDFTGCKFNQSNLRGSSFSGCRFDYSEFRQTHIEPEILDDGLPMWVNLQQKFIQSLRVNFREIGDVDSENKAIVAELNATKAHLKKSWSSKSPYYRSKFNGFERFVVFIEWIVFCVLDFFWGNGESVLKLARSFVVALIVIAAFDLFIYGDWTTTLGIQDAFIRSCEMFFGISHPDEYSSFILSFLTFLRYVMLACFVSIIIKRFAKR